MFYSTEASLINNTDHINQFFSEQLQKDFLRRVMVSFIMVMPYLSKQIQLSSLVVAELSLWLSIRSYLGTYQNGFAVFSVDHQAKVALIVI